MRKLSNFIYILLVCALLATGCSARTYSDSTEPTQDSSTTDSTTTQSDNSEENTDTQESTTETTTEEPTTLPPTPYELLLEGTPLNEAGNVFKINANINLSEDSFIQTYFEWLDGVILTIYDYTLGEFRVIYMDPISMEIFAEISFPAQEYSTSIYIGQNDTLIIANITNNSIDIYDRNFTLLNRFYPPESVTIFRFPVISSDGRYAYYSDEIGSTCYRMSLDTGISEAALSFDTDKYSKSVSDIIRFGDREILILSVYDYITYESSDDYYDTDTFELIQNIPWQVQYEACGSGYGCQIYDLTSQIIHLPEPTKDSAKEFFPQNPDEYYAYWFIPDNKLLTFITVDDPEDALFNQSCIRVYDLTTGKCAYETNVLFNTDSTEYSGGYISNIMYSPKYNAIMGIFRGMEHTFFLWDLNNDSSRSSDETIYTDKYYSSDEINTDGINAMKAIANELGIKYGVNIRIADETRTDTGDYFAEQVFQPTLIRNALTILDEALSNYPKDFFYQLQNEDDVPLEINLSGTISPVDGYDSISNAVGLHNYNLGNQYIILDINNQYLLETTIYHEIFHAIDWIVSYNSIWFDNDWNTLNPKDFEYDYGYNSNENNNDTTYLYYTDEGYFIDIYSKSYPNEDRARIMENAMAGNHYYFESEGLYRKLSYICKALREVFSVDTWGETTCWEAALLPMKEYYGEQPSEAVPETN